MSIQPTEQAVSSGREGNGAVVLQDMLTSKRAALGSPTASDVRWDILALAFAGTTINYVDRQVWNIIGPFLGDMYHITKPQWGIIGSAFAWSYAFGQLMAGGILDRVGVRVGYPTGLFLWSVVAILHAAAVGLGGAVASILGLSIGSAAVGFTVLRSLLGIMESPNYPAVTKALSEWFPKKERAFAMGFVNAGSNVGILIALLLVEPITTRFGWQWAFVVTGSLGLIWLLFWIPVYRKPAEHSRVSPEELAYINSDPPETTIKIPWRTLLGYRQAWAFAISKFITDAMWWFYMVWFAQFLKDRYALNLYKIGLPLIVVFLLADLGSVGGGWLSSSMIRRGASVNRARKTALFLSALLVVPIMFAAYPNNLWISIVLLGLATAGHQGFSSNLYTLVSDTFPRRAVAGVAGLGGTFGYVGAALWAGACGYILQATGNKYMILFVVAGLGYVVSFAIIQLLMPRLEPVVIGDAAPAREAQSSYGRSDYSTRNTKSKWEGGGKPIGVWGLCALGAGTLSLALRVYLLVARADAGFVITAERVMTLSLMLWVTTLLMFVGNFVFDRPAGRAVRLAQIGLLLAVVDALLFALDIF